MPRREGVASIKEAVTLRRIVKRAPPHVRADEGYNSAGINQQSDLLASCSGGSDALAELTAEDLASIPAINCAPNHNNSSHNKVFEFIDPLLLHMLCLFQSLQP